MGLSNWPVSESSIRQGPLGLHPLRPVTRRCHGVVATVLVREGVVGAACAARLQNRVVVAKGGSGRDARCGGSQGWIAEPRAPASRPQQRQGHHRHPVPATVGRRAGAHDDEVLDLVAELVAEPEEVFDVPIRDRRRQFHLDPHQHTATSLDQQIDLVFSPVCPESFASGLLLPVSRKEPAGAPSPAGLGLANPFRAVQSDGGQLRQQLIQPLVNYPSGYFIAPMLQIRR